ncbi:MAG TPA: hemolysin III family protein [Anaeromyxobacteraceae bacterium]|jgi:hemolysin III|nr:hemolysin III family protein [Anaeromyxobacteraceae bacterium]
MARSESNIQPRVKPLLRGVSHEVAAFVAVAAWLVLLAFARGPRASVAATVYGASLFVMFGTSALYHRPTWAPGPRLWLRRLDHSAIFVLIAGTYTPFCLLLGGRRGLVLLAIAWGGALLGILRAMFWPRAPRALAVALYLALGWVIVPVLPQLYGIVGGGGVALLAAGGLLYTVGALIYATRRPDPFPRIFGYHEVFHALVIAAAACHYAVVVGAVRATA